MDKPKINETKISGTARYLAGDNDRSGCSADISITFWREGDELKGTIHFEGHEPWDANIPPTRITAPFPELPTLTVLCERAREFLCVYMGTRSYVHREIKLNPPR